MSTLVIINSKGERVIEIEGPIFPRKDCPGDYIGYWVNRVDAAEGEGMLLQPEKLLKWMEKMYAEEF